MFIVRARFGNHPPKPSDVRLGPVTRRRDEAATAQRDAQCKAPISVGSYCPVRPGPPVVTGKTRSRPSTFLTVSSAVQKELKDRSGESPAAVALSQHTTTTKCKSEDRTTTKVDKAKVSKRRTPRTKVWIGPGAGGPELPPPQGSFPAPHGSGRREPLRESLPPLCLRIFTISRSNCSYRSGKGVRRMRRLEQVVAMPAL